jgi:hypothetical protein
MYRINTPVTRKWAYVWDQQVDVCAIRSKLAIFDDVIVTCTLTIADNPVNDFVNERLLEMGLFPTTVISRRSEASAPVSELTLHLGQNSDDKYAGTFTLMPDDETLRGARG